MQDILTGAMRAEIIARAKALGITGTPDKSTHPLGDIETLDGVRHAHVVHAVDAIISDGASVVLINRSNPPGVGKPALPGGFIDPRADGLVEGAVQAAAREALEEAGIQLSGGRLIGTRNFDRPGDIRVAWNDMPARGIEKDDVFLVSTQGVHFVAPDLAATHLIAGDDAAPGSARRVPLSALRRGDMGIGDHYDMIKAAGLIL